jgi:hypothetical protein
VAVRHSRAVQSIECDATGRKSPQQDRSHEPRREANGGSAVREIRTLRSTWRGLETWHGIGLNRRAGPRPYLGARGGATPPRDSPRHAVSSRPGRDASCLHQRGRHRRGSQGLSLPYRARAQRAAGGRIAIRFTAAKSAALPHTALFDRLPCSMSTPPQKTKKCFSFATF